MRRREFIALAVSATALPVVAEAQQDQRTRGVAVLMGLAENDPAGPPASRRSNKR
jgi:hypothetical protein